jgi:hypothetical protein
MTDRPPSSYPALFSLLLLLLIPASTAGSPGHPQLEGPVTEKPAPWKIESSHFRGGDTVRAVVNVTDLNGSADIRMIRANITSPAGLEGRALQSQPVGYITDGRQVAFQYTVPEAAPTGGWNITVWAEDRDGHATTNRSSFTVTSFSNITVGLEYSISGSDSVYVDGSPATEGIYPAGGIDLPYIVSETPSIMAGLIGHSPLIQLGFANLTGAAYRMNATHDFADNQILLPLTETDHTGLEQQSRYIREPRLLSPPRYLAYPIDDLQEVIIEISYADTSIDLRGFTGRLGPGSHSILIKNRGKNNGQKVIKVIPS